MRISTTLESILRMSGDEGFAVSLTEEVPREGARARFVLEERYLDDAAAAAQHATPHFTYYLSRIGDLAERTAIALEPLEVA